MKRARGAKWERAYSNLLGMLAFSNANHPEELVDIVARVANDAAENSQNVVDIQIAHDLVGGRLVARHRHTHLSNANIHIVFKEFSQVYKTLSFQLELELKFA